jgi:hypothetical protein
MRPALFTALALFFPLAAGPSLAADGLCEHVKSFEQKALLKLPDGGLQRRWMDFSWGGPEKLLQDEVQIGATLKCHGSDDVAETLCEYVLHNTPHENITALPLGILRCDGFASNQAAQPRHWVEDLSWDLPSDLIEQIQIDQLGGSYAEPAMRLSILPFPESSDAKKPPPFFKALSTKVELYNED